MATSRLSTVDRLRILRYTTMSAKVRRTFVQFQSVSNIYYEIRSLTLKVHLLSTCIVKDAMPECVARLLQTVSIAAADGLDIRHIILFQSITPEKECLLNELPSFVIPVPVPGIISLSDARNVMLKAAFTHCGFADDGLVVFPDDDCWYPDGYLRSLLALFEADQLLDFAFCHYSSQPQAPTDIAALAIRPKVSHAARNASSNTICLRTGLVRKVGYFDPNLGVGTASNGGEDTDYALRALLLARRSIYIPVALVGHRDKTTGLRAKYYAGSLLALRRSAFKNPGMAREWIRKIAIGMALTLRGEMTPANYFKAISKRPQSPPSV